LPFDVVVFPVRREWAGFKAADILRLIIPFDQAGNKLLLHQVFNTGYGNFITAGNFGVDIVDTLRGG
jgi:hypothetical protein